MTIQQAADYLQISRDTLYKYAQASRVPAIKVGRHWRFSRRSLDAWMHPQDEIAAPATPPPPVVSSESLQILVVDDELTPRRLIGAWVTQLGHQAQFAASGKEALEILARQRFDIVFLDLYLTDMTGTEILARLPKKDGPSVVLITGVPDSEAMGEALQYPVAYALSKPFQKADVSGVIEMIRMARVKKFAPGATSVPLSSSALPGSGETLPAKDFGSFSTYPPTD